MTIEDLDTLLDQTRQLMTQAEESFRSRAGRMQLGDLVGVSHLENKHSDIIGFLLQPEANHRHPEYGECFLSALREQGVEIAGNTISRVEREYGTDERRRIDIFIETNRDVIILENKLYAADSENQITDYVSFVKSHHADKKIAVVYLTLDGKEPSQNSLSPEIAAELSDQNSLLLTSYGETILPWLKRLQTRAQGEEILRAAIIQYTDMIEGLCGMREEHMIEKRAITSHYIKKYGQIHWADFRDLYHTGRALENALEAVYLIKTLEALYNLIARRGHQVFFTQAQKRYSDISQWISAVIGAEKFVGVEVALEVENAPEHGLAIEFSNVTRASKLTYGIMGKGKKSQDESRFQRVLRDTWSDCSISSSSWWWAQTSALKWAVGTLFGESIASGGSESRDESQKVLSEIAEEWFSDTLIARLRNAE